MDTKSRPLLRVVDGPNEGTTFEIVKERVIIGRSTTAEWTLPFNKISREHVVIYWQEGHWWLKDLDSTNHTYCNGSKQALKEPVILQDGMRVQLAGEIVFQFHDSDATGVETTTQMLTKGIWINQARHEVYINNRLINPPLPGQLFSLLEVLWANEGQVIDNHQVVVTLWPEASKEIAKDPITRNTIDQYFSLLTARLKKEDPRHNYLETVRGKGRRFVQKG